MRIIAVVVMIYVGKMIKQSVQTANKQCVKYAKNTDANVHSKSKKSNKHTIDNTNRGKDQYQTGAQTHIMTV